ncbi:MAG TPA: TRAP transporter substrate-binding protein DctP [Candidatus Baltobacteraceae bacterium]
MKRATVIASLAAIFATRAKSFAQVSWSMATDYPRDSMSGAGIVAFTEELARASRNELTVSPAFDGSGVKASQAIAAIGAGSLQAGDVFGGVVGATDPIFLLSSLPFLTTSTADARRLYEIARPTYEATFTRLGHRLLYVSPWPPSGIWAKIPVREPSDVAQLHIRTYDATSTTVMNALGAHAQSLTFGEAMPLLKSGAIDAVLSSGDGGAGRKLWEYFPVYTKLEYAFPLSFATMNKGLYDALEPNLRAAVDGAASHTQMRQWTAIETRLARNEETMRANNVTIVGDVSPALRKRAAVAAADAITAWKAQVGAPGRAILDRFS